MPAYTTSVISTDRFAPMRAAMRPNRNAKGTPTNCTTMNDRMMASSRRPISAPKMPAILMIVLMPSL